MHVLIAPPCMQLSHGSSGGFRVLVQHLVPPGPLSSIPTFTPCRSLLGSGGGTTASLVLIMGTMFIRRSSCSVLFRFRLFWSSWKSRFVTKIWKGHSYIRLEEYININKIKHNNGTPRITVNRWIIKITLISDSRLSQMLRSRPICDRSKSATKKDHINIF